jgi:ABC-type multidrug transport system ATPase subunit
MELIVENLSKVYKGKIWGLRDFSLSLATGVLGLVGPNGAGKSTLMRILATVTRPTEGRVIWRDANGGPRFDVIRQPNELRAVLGYLPQDFGIYPHLTAVEFLHYLAALKGLDGRTARTRIDALLQTLNLADVCRRPLGGLSGGLRQRVGIAQALLGDPRLLIVDEPTAGLDPGERVRFRSLLADLAGDRAVILSTHIVSDVEAAATEIAILNAGRLVWHSTPEALLRTVEGLVWEWVLPGAEWVDVRQRYLVSSTARRSDGVHVRLLAERAPHPDVRAVAPTLEDAYLYQLSRSRAKEGR